MNVGRIVWLGGGDDPLFSRGPVGRAAIRLPPCRRPLPGLAPDYARIRELNAGRAIGHQTRGCPEAGWRAIFRQRWED